MPTEVEGYFSFRSRRLAIGQFATSTAERGAEVVVEIKMLHPIVTVLANKVPNTAPIPSEIRGDGFDDLTLPAQLSRRIHDVM